MLDEILTRLEKLDAKQLERLEKQVDSISPKQLWYPHPDNIPQCQAYYSKADITLFGGSPGGGKTSLGIGLGLTQHCRSLIVRKQFADLEGVIDNLAGSLDDHKGLVRGNRPKYKNGSISIYFQGMATSGGLDTGKQGTAYDLIYVDEAAQLTENHIRLLIGWNRAGPGVPETQRCRIVLGSNPPVDSTGDWLGTFFAPWFDLTHPNPAKFGELRWFYFDKEGNGVETEHTKPFEMDGVSYYPQSRTYIFSSVDNNPYLGEDYKKNLEMLPEPYRSQLLGGNFLVARKDQQNQIIPTLWIQKAVARFLEMKGLRPDGVPMCSLGLDCTGGGEDNAVIARRYDYFFEPLIKFKTSSENFAAEMAAEIIKCRKNSADIAIDMGGGYGSGVWHILKDNIDQRCLLSFKGGEKPTRRAQNGKLQFANVRTQALWEFREAMDPSVEANLMALPNDNRLIAGLTAPTFEIRGITIHAETKDKVKQKLGFSPDEADAVVMAWYAGKKGLAPATRKEYRSTRTTGSHKMVDKYSNRRGL